ncbi:MAG: DUF3108 domain-containing protein [Thermodesulfovibrionales bacterium]
MNRTISFHSLFAIFILLTVLFPGPVLSFQVPETLHYDISWTGIKAGESVVSIKKVDDHVVITVTTRSAKWVSVFYKVDDVVESTLTAGNDKNILGQRLKYRLNLKEGRHRKDKEVIFDNQGSKALYIDYLADERKEFDLPSGVFDPLSSFYHLRGMQLEVGKSVYIRIFDSKKIYDAEVKVLRKERVAGPAGEIDSLVLKPLMKSEGIFYQKGDMLIWVTDDDKKIPVKMKVQVKIGSVTARLTGGHY